MIGVMNETLKRKRREVIRSFLSAFGRNIGFLKTFSACIIPPKKRVNGVWVNEIDLLTFYTKIP